MRILFVTATRVGDAVLSTGILSRLLDDHPGARVTVACGPAAAPLFEAVPGLERLIVLEKMVFSLHWLQLWAACGWRLWDVRVDLRNAPLTYAIPARRAFRVRRGRRGRDAGHRVEELAQVLGSEGPPPAPRVWLADRHRAAARELVPDGPPVLAVGPTANWIAKQWPADRFTELAARLTGPNGILPGGRVAVFGRADERPGVIRFIEALPDERRIDLVGGLDLLTAAACLGRAALYVGNDSGLMHLAAAAGVPTLGLFGPSPVAEYAPWGPRSDVVTTSVGYDEIFSPGFDPKATGTLMESLGVDAAEAAARRLWARVNGVAA